MSLCRCYSFMPDQPTHILNLLSLVLRGSRAPHHPRSQALVATSPLHQRWSLAAPVTEPTPARLRPHVVVPQWTLLLSPLLWPYAYAYTYRAIEWSGTKAREKAKKMTYNFTHSQCKVILVRLEEAHEPKPLGLLQQYELLLSSKHSKTQHFQ